MDHVMNITEKDVSNLLGCQDPVYSRNLLKTPRAE